MGLWLNAQMLCRSSTRRPRMKAVDRANCALKLKVDFPPLPLSPFFYLCVTWR